MIDPKKIAGATKVVTCEEKQFLVIQDDFGYYGKRGHWYIFYNNVYKTSISDEDELPLSLHNLIFGIKMEEMLNE